ncbi:hypothetical protein NKH47_21670 [Mesorhizobium sp. M1060]|uniref:hypothetical protein n=1 Tax=Mesorhizobium sp. M1060 TaxID=2957052 RepID=UPI003338D62B
MDEFSKALPGARWTCRQQARQNYDFAVAHFILQAPFVFDESEQRFLWARKFLHPLAGQTDSFDPPTRLH